MLTIILTALTLHPAMATERGDSVQYDDASTELTRSDVSDLAELERQLDDAADEETCFRGPVGVQGFADPGATVCAQKAFQGQYLGWQASGPIRCVTADAVTGEFNHVGGLVPPSDSYTSLPTAGVYRFWQTHCPLDRGYIDRDDAQMQFGGTWFVLQCGPGIAGGN